jgi:four helix bundle protein
VAISAIIAGRSNGCFCTNSPSLVTIPGVSAGMRLAFHRRMTDVKSFKDLTVWRVSMDLADICLDIVESIPHPYRFTFASQLIPAGISIPSNIAEGSRRSTKAYLNHLSYSLGSHGEVETLFELIRRRKLVPEPLLSKGTVLIDPIGRMLHGLAASLEERELPNPQPPIPNP